MTSETSDQVKTEHAISLLKSALIVDSSYKNEFIRDAIKVLDPEVYVQMQKEFNDLLIDIASGNIAKYMDI